MRVESGWRRVKGVQVCEVHTTCKVYKQVEWCNVRRHDSHTNMHVDSMCIEHTHTQRCVLALHKCPNVPGLTFSRSSYWNFCRIYASFEYITSTFVNYILVSASA